MQLLRYFIVWYSSYTTWQTCVDGYFLAINKTHFKTRAFWITFFTLNKTLIYQTRMCQCVTSLFQCVSVCYWLWWRKQHRCVCVLLPPSDTTSQKHLCSLSIIILQHLLPCVFPPILYSFLLVTSSNCFSTNFNFYPWWQFIVSNHSHSSCLLCKSEALLLGWLWPYHHQDTTSWMNNVRVIWKVKMCASPSWNHMCFKWELTTLFCLCPSLEENYLAKFFS